VLGHAVADTENEFRVGKTALGHDPEEKIKHGFCPPLVKALKPIRKCKQMLTQRSMIKELVVDDLYQTAELALGFAGVHGIYHCFMDATRLAGPGS
jgi:DNA-binding helix-hairpin-helix protein with protein kinase domain